ncbi:MAG: glycosyltransferase [Rhizonema sp. PD37]|nr:glycosyltransferase [Rhizonema sp. PD37]
MKVLHVIPSVAPERGGPSFAIIEMVKALRDSGIEAEIATINHDELNVLDRSLKQCTDYQQVPVWFFPRVSPNLRSIEEFAFSSQFTTWLWQAMQQYDLLHVHGIFSYPSTVAMAIARLKGVPYIVRPLGQLCEWSLQQKTRKKQIYLKLIEKANLNHSHSLHFTSQQEQQEVSRLNLKSPSFILPHGLFIPPTIRDAHQQLRKHLNVSIDEPIILFLSRLHSKKGLDYLIPAMGQLTNYRFTFVIAGSGSPEYEREVQSLLISHHIQNRTHCIGFVKGEIKDLLIQGADLFALTSHSENFGVAVLEALAVGLPVLVTPGVALASVVKQYQLGYVPELNSSAIACALEDYLKNPELARNMGKSARQLVFEKYNWENIASQMQQVYTKIIQQKPVSDLARSY